MDIDQSSLSTRITGSVIKNIDVLICQYLLEWIHTGTMPESQLYGLDSGYADWFLAPRYKEEFQPAVTEARRVAIEKEKEYYETKAH